MKEKISTDLRANETFSHTSTRQQSVLPLPDFTEISKKYGDQSKCNRSKDYVKADMSQIKYMGF